MCGMNAINEHIACISLSLCIGAIDYVLFNVVRAMWMQNQAGAQTCAERIHIHVKECQIPRKWIASLYSTANYNIAVRTLNLLCTLQLLASIKIKNLKKKNERTNANTYTQRQRNWRCYSLQCWAAAEHGKTENVFVLSSGISLFQWKLIVFKMLFSNSLVYCSKILPSGT